MLRRRNHGRPDGQQPLVGELRGRDRPRAYTPNTDGAAAVEYGLDHGARLKVEFQQSCGEFLLESSHSGGERRKWKRHVDGHAQFRFEPASKSFRPSLEEVDIARHCTGVGEKCATLIRQHWETRTAIEELHAKLPFQIRENLAHHRLSTPQAAAGRREAAFVRGRYESAQLI
jgi:hypothetical protein